MHGFLFCFEETDMPLLPPISIGGIGLLEVDLCLGIIVVAFSTLQTVKNKYAMCVQLTEARGNDWIPWN